MSFVTFLMWCLCTYGIMFGIKYSVLAMPIRVQMRRLKFFDEMLKCAFCTGFWSGMASALLLLPLPCSWPSALLCVATGFAGATVSYALDSALIRLEGGGEH
jgi:hypothetical protein